MRCVKAGFAGLKEAFWREKDEGEDQHAQHVILPRAAPVSPEEYLFKNLQKPFLTNTFAINEFAKFILTLNRRTQYRTSRIRFEPR